jgi:PqqD family protein of HPr-rel-A system
VNRFEAVDGLRVLDFGDEALIFDPLSWDAHVLNPAAWLVLAHLIESSRTEDEVEKLLGAALHPDEQAQAAQHAQRLLGELRALRLARVTHGSALADR